MTEELKQKIEQYVAWVRANGVDVEPSVNVGTDHIAVDGYTVPTYIDWKNGRGYIYRQPVALVFNGGDDFTAELFDVQSHMGLDNQTRVKWADWLNPPAAPAVPGDPVIGRAFDASRRLFYAAGVAVEGAEYTQPGTGRRFRCVANGMFDRKWQEID
jgi:hypothetical protein